MSTISALRPVSVVWRCRAVLAVVATAALGVGGVLVGQAATAGATDGTTFLLHANPAVVSCLGVAGQPAPSAKVTVSSGDLNDQMTVQLQHFKPGLAFDLFTVERSSQLANGSPNPTPGFGLAWYQSDIEVGSNGSGSAHVRSILLNQIFGFDPDVALAPVNTFHVGFWFNDPADAAACGFTGVTPFNGEHTAGPLAMISRPNAATKLGPLCIDPNLTTHPVTCTP